MAERERRKTKLTPEQKWQIFLEASRKNTTDAEVCRRWGIEPHQLRVIRERARDGSLKAFSRKPGRQATDPQIAGLRAELERTTGAMHELAIENTLLRGKVNRV
ncbi:MAG: transposase [Actinomycetota bacterium]